MSIDQDVISRNIGVRSGYVADTSHVSREIVYLVNSAAGGVQAIVILAEVKDLELIGCRRFVFGQFDIHAADPVTFRLQTLNQMMADETSGTRDQYSWLLFHCYEFSFMRLKNRFCSDFLLQGKLWSVPQSGGAYQFQTNKPGSFGNRDEVALP